MMISDFEVGKEYAVMTHRWDAPDGSGSSPGKSIRFTVLPAQEIGQDVAFDGEATYLASAMEVEARKGFLRVQHECGRVRLVHPETLASATLIGV